MASHRESVLLAGIVVVLVSIPAASQNVEISGDVNGVGLIDSRFSDRFEVDFGSGEEVTRYMDKSAKLRVNKSFDKNVRELDTASGYVKVVRTDDWINKSVETPYGDFDFGVVDGESFESYSGSNKSKAEEVKQNLLDRLDDRVQEARDKRDLVIERMLPDIRVSVEKDTDIEHFNLTNKEDESVNMNAWTVVTNDTGKDYLTLERSIDAGETITYYAGEGSGKRFGENVVDTDITIYSAGTLKLYNQVEKRIAMAEDY